MISIDVEGTIKRNVIVMGVFSALLAVPLMYLIRKSLCAEIQTFWVVAFSIACAVAVAKCTTDWSVTRVVKGVHSVEHRLIWQQQYI